MKTRPIILALAALLLFAALAWGGGPADPPRPGPWKPVWSYHQWRDPARGRMVPVKLYRPQDAPGPWPVVLLSHGLGGGRDTMGYWAKHVASRGYAVAALQHPGSDVALRQGKNLIAAYWNLWRAARDPQQYVDRARDLSFVLEKLAALNRAAGPWQSRLDLARVAAAGHSMGALTALLTAGQDFGQGGLLREPLLRAFIALSPPVPQGRDQTAMYGPIPLPGLHISGDRDEARLGSTPAQERRAPYDHIIRADQYLLWLNGGDHRSPLGHPPGPDRPRHEARFHQLILMASDAFLDAYVRGEPGARAWLQGPGMSRAAGEAARWEWRRAK